MAWPPIHWVFTYFWMKILDSCSIGLYASNPIRKVVPEKHVQITNRNHWIRRRTPDKVAIDAFGASVNALPKQAFSSFLVERFHTYSGISYPVGVMY